MRQGEIDNLERIAEGKNDEAAKLAMVMLRNMNPTYHWCAEWDYAVICDKYVEWNTCLCDLPGGHGRLNKKKHGLFK